MDTGIAYALPAPAIFESIRERWSENVASINSLLTSTRNLPPLASQTRPVAKQSKPVAMFPDSQRLQPSLLRLHAVPRTIPNVPPSGFSLARGNEIASERPGELPSLPPYFLTALGFTFARIQPNDHETCRTFIRTNPSTLQLESNDFLKEAIKAEANEQIYYARACIQRAVILQKCAGLTSKGTSEYLQDLSERKLIR